MLSIVDLIDAGTVTAVEAARVISRLRRGSSLLVGARPGGAGKTTVMGAFLALLPPARAAMVAERDTRWQQSCPGDLVVAYEIGQGAYEGYVWGEELRALARLGLAGIRIAANLHADTLDEARDQIVGDNGVDEEGFRAFGLFVPLRVSRGRQGFSRRIGMVMTAGEESWRPLDDREAPFPEEPAIRAFIENAAQSGVRTIQDLRSEWLGFERTLPRPASGGVMP